MTYRYRVSAVGYGAELTIGTVRSRFVKYWGPILDEDGDTELVEHLLDDEEDRVTEIDPVTGYQGEWFELNDLEGTYTITTDSRLMIQQVDEDDNDLDTDEIVVDLDEVFQMHCRECYMQNHGDVDDEDSYEPVLMMTSNEKGCFWTANLELEQPIDVRLFGMGILECNVGEFVETLYYNGEIVDFDHDQLSTRGKSYSATVGWLNPEYHNTEIDPELDEWEYYVNELEAE